MMGVGERVSIEQFINSVLSSSAQLGPSLEDLPLTGRVPEDISRKFQSVQFHGDPKKSSYVPTTLLHAYAKEKHSNYTGPLWDVRATGFTEDNSEHPSKFDDISSVKGCKRKLDVFVYRETKDPDIGHEIAGSATGMWYTKVPTPEDPESLSTTESASEWTPKDWRGETKWHLVRLFVEMTEKASFYNDYTSESSQISVHSGSDIPSNTSDIDDGTGLVIEYAGMIRLHQHRTHIFSVYIHEEQAILIRWDPAGVVVTHAFPIKDDLRQLYRFFYIVRQMTDHQLGLDPTVESLQAGDVDLWMHCAGSLPDTTRWQRQLKQQILNAFGDPLCRSRVKVNADKPTDAKSRWDSKSKKGTKSAAASDTSSTVEPLLRTRTLLIGCLYTGQYTATEKGTKGFIALDIESERFVFLKDCWRVDFRDANMTPEEPKPEIVIYWELENAEVQNIPTIMYGGDVHYPAPEGAKSRQDPNLQRTQNHCHPVIRGERPRIHTRLVMEEIGTPLNTYSNSRELVTVVRDALAAHRQAWEKAKRLHCDISDTNIVIWGANDGTTKGLLCDWDMSKHQTELGKAVRQKETSDTWIFLSGPCVVYPKKPYLPPDEFDATAQLLKWLYLRWHKHSLHNAPSLQKKIYATFYTADIEEGYWKGSHEKLQQMRLGIVFPDINLALDVETSPGFLTLLKDLIQLCKEHYDRYDWEAMEKFNIYLSAEASKDPKLPMQGRAATDSLGPGPLDDHNRVLEIFNNALAKTGCEQWHCMDKGSDNFAGFQPWNKIGAPSTTKRPAAESVSGSSTIVGSSSKRSRQ